MCDEMIWAPKCNLAVDSTMRTRLSWSECSVFGVNVGPIIQELNNMIPLVSSLFFDGDDFAMPHRLVEKNVMTLGEIQLLLENF